MNDRDLALTLAKCESEKEVVDLLRSENLWDNPKYWRYFGDNENNWSTIGNQQSEPESALVEKIVNSIDAILMKECNIRNILPDSEDAPKSIEEALTVFFSIKDGKIQNLTSSDRTKLAKDIIVSATGSKPNKRSKESKFPCITIIDKGEGQTPKKLPDTILSINKSNKLKVPFVQGKFNMGGTGVLRFCGNENLQLIISKRCPDIAVRNDETHNDWGVTLIRRERPTNNNGRRSSVFTYLVNDSNNIRSFNTGNDGLAIIPKENNINEILYFGMYCKLFEYNLPSRYATNINMGLYYRLSTLLPNLAYPVTLIECRDYSGHTLSRTLSGLNVRLNDMESSDESNKIQEKLNVTFNIDSQTIEATIYVFKNKLDDGKELDLMQFRADEGIMLIQNGQTHSSFDRKFYRRTNVGLSYLADHLLTIVDCTNINETTREDLFMNSRDRMSSNSFQKKLEQNLEDFFRSNEILKKIQFQRREAAISDKLDDEKPLVEVLESIFKSSSVLSKLFITGDKIHNPVNYGSSDTSETFKGKYNPTFFKLAMKNNVEPPLKEAQKNKRFRITFITDANNDFFVRDSYKGEFMLICDGVRYDNYSINLHNGFATLTVSIHEEANVGDIYNMESIVRDNNNLREFRNDFRLLVIDDFDTKGGYGDRRLPAGETKQSKTLGPIGLSLPNILEVYKKDWEDKKFDKETALKVFKISGESNQYDFYINMDNLYLNTESIQFSNNDEMLKLIKSRYKYAMVLYGMSIIGYYSKYLSTESPEEAVEKFTKMISPVTIPIINVLGQNINDNE